MNFLIKKILITSLAFVPALVFAAPRDFKDFTLILITLLQDFLNVLSILAVIYFLWGLAVFILRVGGDEKAVTEGKQRMVWGLIALFVMLSLWAIVNLVAGEFNWVRDGFGLPFLKTP